MKGLLLIRRLFPEWKNNPKLLIDYEIGSDFWPIVAIEQLILVGRIGCLPSIVDNEPRAETKG